MKIKRTVSFVSFTRQFFLILPFLGLISHLSFHWVASLHSHSSLSLLHTMLKSLSWQSACLHEEEEWRSQREATLCSCGTRPQDPRQCLLLPSWMLLLRQRTHLSCPLCLRRRKQERSFKIISEKIPSGQAHSPATHWAPPVHPPSQSSWRFRLPRCCCSSLRTSGHSRVDVVNVHLYSWYELRTSPVVRAPAPRPTAPAAKAVLATLWDKSRLIVLKQCPTELLLELEEVRE